MRNASGLFTFFALATVALTANPLTARADVAARVNGGGTADFVATPNSVTTSGYTDFSAAVTVYDDGTATGRFVCQIPAIVVISGDVLGGTVNGDGSVTIVGLARGYDHVFGVAFKDLPFTTTFRGGGPGVGGFDYRDESGYFGPGQFDTEVVRKGMIIIR